MLRDVNARNLVNLYAPISEFCASCEATRVKALAILPYASTFKNLFLAKTAALGFWDMLYFMLCRVSQYPTCGVHSYKGPK